MPNSHSERPQTYYTCQTQSAAWHSLLFELRDVNLHGMHAGACQEWPTHGPVSKIICSIIASVHSQRRSGLAGFEIIARYQASRAQHKAEQRSSESKGSIAWSSNLIGFITRVLNPVRMNHGMFAGTGLLLSRKRWLLQCNSENDMLLCMFICAYVYAPLYARLYVCMYVTVCM